MLILLLLLPNGDEKKYTFEASSSIKIGSDPLCDVVILDDIVEKVHCVLVLYHEGNYNFYYLLFDGEILGSPSINGTWVGGERIFSKCKVNNQDIVTFSENRSYPHLILFPDGAMKNEK